MTATLLRTKHLTTISKLFTKHTTVLVVVLFAFGIFFRSLFFLNSKVGFDQVQILEQANAIASFDITLIGPRTGPADMFTGPLIYYVSAPFVLLLGDYLTMGIVPVVIALITGISIFFVSKRYFDQKSAIILTMLWAFSPFLVHLDKSFWNPNFVLLSSFLLFSQLYTKKSDKFTPWLLFLGAFLAYQAHFSSLVLIGIALLSIIFFKKPLKLLVPIIAGLATSLLPTVLFDIKNGFINLNGFISLASGSTEFSVISLFQSFFKNIFILFETFGKIILFGNTTFTIVALGLTLFVLALFILPKKNLFFSLFWLLSVAGIYAFYSGEKPEYYFLIIVPIFMFWIAEIMQKTKPKILGAVLFFFLLNAFLINTTYYALSSGSTIGSIFKTEKYFGTLYVQSIAYDVPLGTDFGLKYFLRNIPLTESGTIVHIAHAEDLQENQRAFALEGLRVWEEKPSNQPTESSEIDIIVLPQ